MTEADIISGVSDALRKEIEFGWLRYKLTGAIRDGISDGIEKQLYHLFDGRQETFQDMITKAFAQGVQEYLKRINWKP